MKIKYFSVLLTLFVTVLLIGDVFAAGTLAGTSTASATAKIQPPGWFCNVIKQKMASSTESAQLARAKMMNQDAKNAAHCGADGDYNIEIIDLDGTDFEIVSTLPEPTDTSAAPTQAQLDALKKNPSTEKAIESLGGQRILIDVDPNVLEQLGGKLNIVDGNIMLNGVTLPVADEKSLPANSKLAVDASAKPTLTIQGGTVNFGKEVFAGVPIATPNPAIIDLILTRPSTIMFASDDGKTNGFEFAVDKFDKDGVPVKVTVDENKKPVVSFDAGVQAKVNEKTEVSSAAPGTHVAVSEDRIVRFEDESGEYMEDKEADMDWLDGGDEMVAMDQDRNVVLSADNIEIPASSKKRSVSVLPQAVDENGRPVAVPAVAVSAEEMVRLTVSNAKDGTTKITAIKQALYAPDELPKDRLNTLDEKHYTPDVSEPRSQLPGKQGQQTYEDLWGYTRRQYNGAVQALKEGKELTEAQKLFLKDLEPKKPIVVVEPPLPPGPPTSPPGPPTSPPEGPGDIKLPPPAPTPPEGNTPKPAGKNPFSDEIVDRMMERAQELKNDAAAARPRSEYESYVEGMDAATQERVLYKMRLDATLRTGLKNRFTDAMFTGAATTTISGAVVDMLRSKEQYTEMPLPYDNGVLQVPKDVSQEDLDTFLKSMELHANDRGDYSYSLSSAAGEAAAFGTGAYLTGQWAMRNAAQQSIDLGITELMARAMERGYYTRAEKVIMGQLLGKQTEVAAWNTFAIKSGGRTLVRASLRSALRSTAVAAAGKGVVQVGIGSSIVALGGAGVTALMEGAGWAAAAAGAAAGYSEY